MDLTNSVRCSRCSMEMRETILQDIPTCRVSNYYCEKCAIMISLFQIQESRLEEIGGKMYEHWEVSGVDGEKFQEVHPLEDK